jgi:enediyne polyketide synthase
MNSIAIVGMACRYPDARSPQELWENALAQRRAFRRIPDERFNLADYLSDDRGTPDHTYSQSAAVIEGYEFDRVGYRVSGPTFRSVDLTHWLALDVAAQSLADAGFEDGAGLPRELTGVFLGNTLAGEFARANVLRLRWPYVRRILESELAEKGWDEATRAQFLETLESRYKSAFPPVGEETLAGGMSNTIAGRICNYFDLKGGGYTLDGACASSLLATANACSALVSGDLDVAIAGGVDLSLDPFELIGFAKVGALAADKMRVFDERSAGFWPGEGCGIVVLMRTPDAIRSGSRIYATVRGWGISSDGSGGITRPEVEGQMLALRRAYRRAGIGIDTVDYFEAHGTGTAVGDTTELTVLSRARREADPHASPAALSTIKANIGHTKAAAGVAGMIKAAMALHHRVLPPITGCDSPHPQLRELDPPALRLLRRGEPWPEDRPRRAGVSAMGFGGINTHLVLEGEQQAAPQPNTGVFAAAQDAEIFLFAADDRDELLKRVEHLAAFAARLSEAELTDLAAELARSLGPGRLRAAIVAASPQALADRLQSLAGRLRSDADKQLETASGVFLGEPRREPRIGFLFPGQGSPVNLTGGLWRHRFACVDELYQGLDLPPEIDTRSTRIAQPAIVRATLAGLRLLDRLGLRAAVGVGHSLGELTALHWAGGVDEPGLMRIVAGRARAMADLRGDSGAMASIFAGRTRVEELLNGYPVIIAGLNAPSQTVISGESPAVAEVVRLAQTRGLKTASLPVSHAFHSPLVAAAVPILIEHLERETFMPLRRRVFSTVTGDCLAADADLRGLIARQVTLPVRFREALESAETEVELWFEVGPGTVLSGLAREGSRVPSIALDAAGSSVEGLLNAAGAAFVLGAPLRHEGLFEGRLTRPFDLDWRPKFFRNPCESAPPSAHSRSSPVGKRAVEMSSASPRHDPESAIHGTALDVVRELVARRAELPLADVGEHLRLLSDLHLNSIVVGQIVVEAARRLGISAPIAPTQYADARISEVAVALDEIGRHGADSSQENPETVPPGVDAWVRCFHVDFAEKPLAYHSASLEAGQWNVFDGGAGDRTGSFRKAFSNAPGRGVVVLLPPDPDARHGHVLLAAAHQALKSREGNRFVVVEQGGGGGAFARTLHLEAPEIACCVVNVPLDHPQAPQWAVRETLAATGYTEAHYDPAGVRRVPVLRLLEWQDDAATADFLTPDDVLLVTGGGKGIAAECALDLARSTGVRLALLGRSQTPNDPDLRANLERLAAAGVTFRYFAADVTDAASVGAAVQETETALGPVTAVLHAAGTNVPRLIGALDADEMARTFRPKMSGLENVLAAVKPDRLRLLVSFGSLIARTGLPGEADYGLANEWLRLMVERWHRQHPSCRCLHLDWSVWSGAGMGERLGRADLLAGRGIAAIPAGEGVRLLRELIARDLPHHSLVIAGRFGDPPALAQDRTEPRFLRFLEKIRTHVRGVELIADAELSAESDPYLNDHIFEGERILPGVMGLEAMAQAASALLETESIPKFSEVHFDRPVVVREGQPVTIRLAGLVTEPNCCRLVLRSSATAFQVDHFHATCRIGEDEPKAAAGARSGNAAGTVPLDPGRNLYGGILFQSGRFRRLRAYHRLRAKECVAEILPAEPYDWFWQYLPRDLVLGDPGARDAAIHGIQACIPQSTLLPVGVDRIVASNLPHSGPLFVHAQERSRTQDAFFYDVDIADSAGTILEQWRGLRLHRVRDADARAIAGPLLGPYLERRVEELIPEWRAAIVVEHNRDADPAIQRAIGSPEQILRGPDGKPHTASDTWQISASHSRDLVVAVAAREPVSCDAEEVVARSWDLWRDLLGADRFALAQSISAEMLATLDVAATHVWTASECLTKAGAIATAPLMLQRCADNHAVLFASGARKLATLEVKSEDAVRIFAFLMGA